jgi:probable HAF family extracellular repeat protein
MRKHSTIWIVLVSCALLALGARSAPVAEGFTFTSIDFPGAVFTNAQGINSRGDIVGLYVDAAGKRHGFELSDGDFISIDYPGAMVTDARGISRRGEIVGAFTNAPGGPPNMHGYLLKRGIFSEVQFPGYLGTIAQRISPRGDIYGCNHNTDFMASMHGFMRTREGYSAIDVPASMNNGATPDGSTIAGLYTDMNGHSHGYLIDDGSFMPFDVPGSNLTEAWDINPKGLVVGGFRDTSGKTHGFLRTNNEYATIDFPGASVTAARGINRDGDIVGLYVDTSGKTHGFLRSRNDSEEEDDSRPRE